MPEPMTRTHRQTGNTALPMHRQTPGNMHPIMGNTHRRSVVQGGRPQIGMRITLDPTLTRDTTPAKATTPTRATTLIRATTRTKATTLTSMGRTTTTLGITSLSNTRSSPLPPYPDTISHPALAMGTYGRRDIGTIHRMVITGFPGPGWQRRIKVPCGLPATGVMVAGVTVFTAAFGAVTSATMAA